MKEQNIARVKNICYDLEAKRSKLDILAKPLYRDFGIRIETRNATNEGFGGVVVGGAEIPEYIKDVTICLVISELKKQISALEAELETL